MSVYVFPTVELLLDGVHWTDVSADVFNQNGLAIKYGMADGKPTSVVATTGEAQFWLNNSERNSTGTLGYYSPDKAAAVRTGFQRNVRARVSFLFSAVRYYKHVGRVKDIVPMPGRYDARITGCTSVDYMDDLARADLQGIAAQLSVRGDQCLTTLLAAMPTQPAATSFDAGIGMWPYAMVGGSEGVINGLQECQRIALSEAFGFIYVKGDTSTGGVFRFDNRHRRPANNTNTQTLDESILMPGGLEAPASVDDVLNFVKVTVHPVSVDASNVVLYTFVPPTAPNAIGPGAVVTLIAPYRDPNQQASQVAAASIVSPLVASTDYTMNAAADGSGADVTGNFTVSASNGSTGAFVTVTNTSATTPGYLRTLQVRGKGIYDYNPVTAISQDATSKANYGTNQLTLDLPYEVDLAIGQGLADVVRRSWATPFGYGRKVSFLANRSSATMVAALATEVGDRVAVSEAVTGISAGFWVQRVELKWAAGGILTCTWLLAPADPLSYWVLGQVGRSELGVTTRLWPI